MRPRLPSPAMAVACTALAVALGGTAYAATQLPRNSVGRRAIRAGAVGSSEVRDGSLRPRDFARGSRVPAGATGTGTGTGMTVIDAPPTAVGPKGDKGDRGPQGERGPRGPAGVDAAAGDVAYARIGDGGPDAADVTTAKGLAASMVRRQSATTYCLGGLPFEPRNAQATTASAAGLEGHAQVEVAADGGLDACSGAHDQVEVRLFGEATSFFLLLHG